MDSRTVINNFVESVNLRLDREEQRRIEKAELGEEYIKLNATLKDIAEAIKVPNIPNAIKTLNNPQFMELMGISIETAQMWRDKGIVSYIKIGNKIYYRISDIQELLERNYNKSKNK
jgi:hypothetical protein